MIKLLLLLAVTTILSAKYTNCTFQNKNYTEICKKVVKKGVSVDYANRFLLSPKTKKLDNRSFNLFKASKIKTHRKNEKRANNTLVKYLPKMINHLKEYKEVYDEAERKYSVNREIVAAILLKETKLGTIKPSFDAFRVFNTLVVKTEVKTTRDKWLLNMGKTNLVSIIDYCYKKGFSPSTCNFKSSYAGAVGIPQFMPNSFVYIDGYKKKVGDLSVMEDAIMSASKYLNKKAKFKKLIEWEKIPDMKVVEAQWYDYEFKHKNSSLVYSKNTKTKKSYKCFTCKKDELSYLREYAKKIMRYNNSSNYAIGVMRLAYDSYYYNSPK